MYILLYTAHTLIIYSNYIYTYHACTVFCVQVEKMITKGHIEKHILRDAFDTPEDPWLPQEILWRQKEQFSDGVGYVYIHGLLTCHSIYYIIYVLLHIMCNALYTQTYVRVRVKPKDICLYIIVYII